MLLQKAWASSSEQKREMGARSIRPTQVERALEFAPRHVARGGTGVPTGLTKAIDVTLPGRGRAPGGIHPVIPVLGTWKPSSVPLASTWPTAPKWKTTGPISPH